ncbi:hypothetical protein BDV25DRAFT_150871 [Aspergillus avenaceus]|uniref:Uncharacterized protein n=1 Tax=Aspergillus avenaceus TaxID=36643 RepID=A0A5N6U1S1_ASPAV|nr:hypothetical protein BDV25DRAFT_150871 [Aspergillus avenaceus]
MYGSHPYSNSSGQKTSGPPQPEWRMPSTAQQRPARKPTTGPTPPPPPHPPLSAPPYNPTSYSPISNNSQTTPSVSTTGSPVPGSASLDTSAWGVKYNRQQYPIYAPPPLPPRPSSTTGHSSSAHSPAVSPLDSNKPPPVAPTYGNQTTASAYQPQWTSSPSWAPQQPTHTLTPPPPPPIPSGYQTPASQQGHQTPQQPSPPPYSIHPPVPQPSQKFSPQQNASYTPTSVPSPQPALSEPVTAATSASYGVSPPMTAPPVPPKTSAHGATTHASALGSGGPSDWEHLSSAPGDVDDLQTFRPKQDNAVAYPSAPHVPPQNYLAGAPNTASGGPIGSGSPATVSPVMQPIHSQSTSVMQDSPVSSSTTQQDFHEPPRPARVDTSESVYSTTSTTGASESIDGVIDAWNRPVTTQTEFSTAQADRVENSLVDDSNPMQKLSPLEIPKTKQETTVPRKVSSGSNTPRSSPNVKGDVSPIIKVTDPYEDLDPWSKSSLERYVAMLRKEAVADSDEERYKIFTAFMSKETKLREILYSIEHEPKFEEVPSRQPTPAAQHSDQLQSNKSSSPIDSGLIPVESEASSESWVDASEEPGDGSYSPGGRPIVPRIQTPGGLGFERPATQPPGRKHSSGVESQAQHPRATSVPPPVVNKQELSPLTTNPPQPIYAPFRYTEGPQRGSDHLAFDRPAYQAYSALRQASAESGRVMSNAPAHEPHENPNSPISQGGKNEHDETFLGLIREKSVAYRKQGPRRKSSPPPLPMSLRQGRPNGPIDDLRSMVSSPLAKQSESSWHATTRKDLAKYSNDFTYIMEAVKVWETSGRSRREALEKERMHRQEESEKRIDGLFNGRKIGYADINVLEEEFRQTEARVQLDEERRELDLFIKQVFNPLDERLQQEISTLQSHYDSSLGQLDHENSKIKNSVTDKYNLSHTMKTVNEIYHRLEARYQKRVEIALEREKRRRKTERRPLVFMGDSVALKQLDGEFDEMEKRNILEAAKDRDERANRLMDSFDDAIMHGLGENQSLLDDVSAKLSKIDVAVTRSSGLVDSDVEHMLKSVYNVVESLRQDSESILNSFGRADSALNDADYGVSVAEARYANAEPDVFQQLEDAKKKEDAKIQTDLNSKLDSVRTAPAEITIKVNEILESLGKAPVVNSTEPLDSAPANHPADILMPGPRPATSLTSKSDEDSEHQERLRKALEAAKRRNAARTHLQPQN